MCMEQLGSELFAPREVGAQANGWTHLEENVRAHVVRALWCPIQLSLVLLVGGRTGPVTYSGLRQHCHLECLPTTATKPGMAKVTIGAHTPGCATKLVSVTLFQA